LDPEIKATGHACDYLPVRAAREVLGASVETHPEGSVCRYTNTVGEIEITAFTTSSYYSREFATLAAEGMGSLQLHEGDAAITVVLDQGSPELAYLHKGDATYSVNIDRASPPATATE
jgi:hypothetical protein